MGGWAVLHVWGYYCLCRAPACLLAAMRGVQRAHWYRRPLAPLFHPPQLIETTGAALEGRRVLMYSYGSGISASMFSLVGRRPEAPRFALQRLQAMVREFVGELSLGSCA